MIPCPRTGGDFCPRVVLKEACYIHGLVDNNVAPTAFLSPGCALQGGVFYTWVG